MDVMLDLETVGSNPRAPIASIGATSFDRKNRIITGTYYCTIDITCFDRYKMFQVDYSTIKWWLKQDPKAIATTFHATDSLDIREALSQFQIWCAQIDDPKRLRVWGNGADFDNVVLNYAYDVFRILKPWRFNNNRCFRTLKNECPDIYPVFEGTQHNALDDAVHQTNWLFKIDQARASL